MQTSELNSSLNLLDKITELQTLTQMVLDHGKHGLRIHFSKSSTEAYHCMSHGVGIECQHVHLTNCIDCSDFFGYPEVFSNFLLAAQPFFHVQSTKDEIASMANCVRDRINGEFKRFAGHVSRGRWQALAINDAVEQCRTDFSIAHLTFDHKQKVLAIRKHESQVEYFGQKGMALLGFMVMCRQDRPPVFRNSLQPPPAPDPLHSPLAHAPSLGMQSQLTTAPLHSPPCAPVPGMQTTFVDYIMQNSSKQNFVSVIVALEEVVIGVKKSNPQITSVVFQSDNATCFSAHSFIVLIYLLNVRLEKHNIRVARWIFTEAQSGKSRLDTHFAYVNLVFTRYRNCLTTLYLIFLMFPFVPFL
jgi:hypothetical protein